MATMETLVISDSVLGKQRMFKYCMVVGVKFLGVGAIGLFPVRKGFQSPVQSPSKSPTKHKHKKEGWD